MQDAKAARTKQIGNNDRQLDAHLFQQALDLTVKPHAINLLVYVDSCDLVGHRHPPGVETAGSVRRDNQTPSRATSNPQVEGATQIGPNTQPRPNSETASTNPE